MTAESDVINAKELASYLGVSNLFVKLETLKGVGCHKSRAARRLIAYAIEQNFKGVSVGTCGNLGIALALEAKKNQLPLKIFVPSLQSWSDAFEQRREVDIVNVKGTYEDAVEHSSQFAAEHGWFDASPVSIAHTLSVNAFAEIPEEIVQQVKQPIAGMYVPVGNGTTIAGLWQGFSQLGLNPKLHAVGSLGNSAVCESVRAQKNIELDATKLKETWVNQPLVNWRALCGEKALNAVCESAGKSFEVDDPTLLEAASLLQRLENIDAHPSGAAGLAGFIANIDNERSEERIRVVLVTAKTELTL